jgi:hypothetical protein
MSGAHFSKQRGTGELASSARVKLPLFGLTISPLSRGLDRSRRVLSAQADFFAAALTAAHRFFVPSIIAFRPAALSLRFFFAGRGADLVVVPAPAF